MPVPRAPRAASDGPDMACHFCSSACDVSDPKWLCLCTTEVKRVHRNCAVTRGRAGQQNKKCQQCHIENQYETLEPARQRARVIIIGAGPAGLAAAKQLRACGINPVIIEARSRLGGRIQTVRIGESNVDLGAAYIHGCDELYNPVFRLAKQLSVRVDQRMGGYSGGWGVDAPWFECHTGRRIPKSVLEKTYSYIASAKALIEATPLTKLRSLALTVKVRLGLDGRKSGGDAGQGGCNGARERQCHVVICTE